MILYTFRELCIAIAIFLLYYIEKRGDSMTDLSKYAGQKIKQYRKQAHWTQGELAKKLNIGKSAISNYESGYRQPKQDLLFDMAKLFEVSINDFFPDTSDKKLDILSIYNKLTPPRQKKVLECAEGELEEQEEETKVIGFPERKRIIKGRSTAAGAPIDGDVQDSEAETTVVDREEIPRNADEIITIAGDSMEPFLMKGEQAFIEYTPWVENGTAAVVSIEDVGVTCKYVFVEGEDVRLVSENDAYNDMIYPCEEVRIIGKIL